MNGASVFSGFASRRYEEALSFSRDGAGSRASGSGASGAGQAKADATQPTGQAAGADGQSAAGGPTARLRSRTVGFTLGGFGLEYTSESLEVDRGCMAAAASETNRQREAFDVEAEVAGLWADAGTGSGPDRAEADVSRAYRTRLAMAAYAGAMRPEAPPSMLRAVT